MHHVTRNRACKVCIDKAHHSISSSERSSSVSGIVRTSALARVRLITSPKRVGCSIAIEPAPHRAGCAPPKRDWHIRSTDVELSDGCPTRQTRPGSYAIAGREAPPEPDHAAKQGKHHSITRSARCRVAAGSLMPIARAAARLTTNSKRVGRSNPGRRGNCDEATASIAAPRAPPECHWRRRPRPARARGAPRSSSLHYLVRLRSRPAAASIPTLWPSSGSAPVDARGLLHRHVAGRGAPQDAVT